ncbi:MAG: hypothetical protein U0361_13105 [Nitrospiraceae bacterium]
MTRLLYYSYSHNTAVDVRMTESGVLNVERADGYLPPEGPQDIQRGIELARTDSRLAGKVQQLEGHGLLMQPDRGFFRNDPGFAHRVIWILTYRAPGRRPKMLGRRRPHRRPGSWTQAKNRRAHERRSHVSLGTYRHSPPPALLWTACTG